MHDSTGRTWTTEEITDYVNDGRKRVTIDTHCLRSLETTLFVSNQETYPIGTFTSKLARCYDVKNLTVLWGSQRVPMVWQPWSRFNAIYRTWQVNLSRPSVWAFYGTSPVASTIYIQPVPDQDYVAELDCFYFPLDLVNDSTVDELSYPFTAPVAYYAAYKAKMQEQSYGEAQAFLQDYAKKGMEAINSFTARVPDAYT